MGMAASQGRLLMMTARLSNNEFEQQCVAYSKQRLADDSQAANDQYLEALAETQYQLITGYHGDVAQYQTVSYYNLTGFDNVATGKQYIVSDNKGRIVVTDEIAKAFEDYNVDYNKFLEKVEPKTPLTQIAETEITEEMVHEAWDAYFVSIDRGHEEGLYCTSADDTEHIFGLSYNIGTNNGPDYVTTNDNNPIYYEGATEEQRQLYDYAMALIREYTCQTQNGHQEITPLVYDADKVKYYTNIFEQMKLKGFTTFTKMVKDEYMSPTTHTTDNGQKTDALSSYDWLVRNVKNGKLSLSYYSSTQQKFIATTLDDDESIVNKENKAKMAIAEQVYQNHMDHLEAQDKQFDMKLTKLESEHTAIQTEYDSISKVISKNVEKSFSIFNA